jgi:hypothetical protein
LKAWGSRSPYFSRLSSPATDLSSPRARRHLDYPPRDPRKILREVSRTGDPAVYSGKATVDLISSMLNNAVIKHPHLISAPDKTRHR